MVAREHPKVIEGRQWFIDTYVLNHVDTSKDGLIDNDNYASDEEVMSGSLEVVVSTGMDAVYTEKVEEVHQAVKETYILLYMLKVPPLS